MKCNAEPATKIVKMMTQYPLNSSSLRAISSRKCVPRIALEFSSFGIMDNGKTTLRNMYPFTKNNKNVDHASKYVSLTRVNQKKKKNENIGLKPDNLKT